MTKRKVINNPDLKKVKRAISGYTTKGGKKVPAYRAHRYLNKRPPRKVVLPAHPDDREQRTEGLSIHRLRLPDDSTPAGEIIKKRRSKVVSPVDISNTMAEEIYPQDPMLQEVMAAGKVYGIVATPPTYKPTSRQSIDFTREFDARNKIRGFDRNPTVHMDRDARTGRVENMDISLLAADGDVGMAPVFDAELALSTYEGDREEFIRLLSLYMYWAEQNQQTLGRTVKVHNKRHGWNGKIKPLTAGRGNRVVFLTVPNNQELVRAEYQLPLTHMAAVKKTDGFIMFGDKRIPRWDINREQKGETIIVAGEHVTHAGVTSNVGQLPDEAKYRPNMLDFRYRYPTIFTKINPQMVEKIQTGREAVAARDRKKNMRNYHQARRAWAVNTRNSIARASPEKKAKLNRIKQLHIDPAYWEQSEYELLKAVMGDRFISTGGVTPPPRPESYNLPASTY